MIFLDVDDTLLDYKSSQHKAAVEFAKHHSSYLRAPERFPERWNEVTERHMPRHLAGELSFQEQRRQLLSRLPKHQSRRLPAGMAEPSRTYCAMRQAVQTAQ